MIFRSRRHHQKVCTQWCTCPKHRAVRVPMAFSLGRARRTRSIVSALIVVSTLMLVRQLHPLGWGIAADQRVAGVEMVWNPLDYGAKCDGVTDDRAVFQAVITDACAATGTKQRKILIPAGTCVTGRNGSNFYSIDIPCDNLTFEGIGPQSVMQLQTGQPAVTIDQFRIISHNHTAFRKFTIDGNWQNWATTIAAASNGVSLPQATINVADNSGFPTAGAYTVTLANDNYQYVQCTGKSGTTQLTGCVGGTGTLFAGNVIGYVNANAGINMTTNSSEDTTVSSLSNGVALPTGTINVTGNPSGWDFTGGSSKFDVNTSVGYQQVVCTGATTSSLTGCTGGTGTLFTGGELLAPGATEGRLFGIGTDSATDIRLEDMTMMRFYGDCISVGGNDDPTNGLKILHSSCTMTSRNALTFASATENVVIDDFTTKYIQAQSIDGEPVGWPVRHVYITNSHIGMWWVTLNGPGAPISVSGGGDDPANWTQGQSARDWRIENTEILGPTLMGNMWDIVFAHNRVIENYPNVTTSGIWASGVSGSLTINDNYFYIRAATTGATTATNCCGILVSEFTSGSLGHQDPTNYHIDGNFLDMRNGRWGIQVAGAGGVANSVITTTTGVQTLPVATLNVTDTTGFPTGSITIIVTSGSGPQTVTCTGGGGGGTTFTGCSGGTGNTVSGGIVRSFSPAISGTSSSVTSTTLADGTAVWKTNEFAGWVVRAGQAMGDIASNTGTQLNLQHVHAVSGTGWATTLGAEAPTPGNTTAYVIYKPMGLIDVSENTVDARNDGWGAGQACMWFGSSGSSNGADQRIRIHHNSLIDCNTNGIQVKWDAYDNYPYTEITDNVGQDDQVTPTLTNLINFTNSYNGYPQTYQLVLRGNVKGFGVTNNTVGITAGNWLVEDGASQKWAGFGAPAFAAPISSQYSRLNGGASTSLYVNESGSAGGWVGK